MTNLTDKDVENIKAKLDSILKLAEPHIAKIKDIEAKLAIDKNFNIFTAIAEKYRHENLHSDLLKVILGNEKNNIENRDIFSKFLDYINIKDDYKNEKEAFVSDYDSIKFQREYPIAIPLNKTKKDKKKQYAKGRIDLLIFNEEACIIIENKINGAPDQQNQLGKYYMQMAIKEKKKVLKIVYLTKEQNTNLSPIFANYDFTKYAPGYNAKSDIIEKINNLLITLPCVTMENSKPSFTKFLETITPAKNEHDNTTDKNTTDAKKVFIDQYKSLITSIGGQVLMSEPEKDLIRDIMNDPNIIPAVNRLTNTWNHRTRIIGELLVEDMQNIAPEMEKANDVKNLCQKKINDDVKIYYTVEDPGSGNYIEFGFRPTGESFKKNLADKLTKAFYILDPKIFKFKGEWGPEDHNGSIKYVCAKVEELGDLKYEDIKQKLKDCLEKLESEALGLLNEKKAQSKKQYH